MPELFADPPPNLLAADYKATWRSIRSPKSSGRKAPTPAPVRPSSSENFFGYGESEAGGRGSGSG